MLNKNEGYVDLVFYTSEDHTKIIQFPIIENEKYLDLTG